MANLIDLIGERYTSWLVKRQLLKMVKEMDARDRKFNELLRKYPEVKVYHVSLADLVKRFGETPTEK